MRVVICGGGVIGACTAYFLSRRGIDVLVVERSEVAAAASGKAGGFLALEWCAGSPLDALARRRRLSAGKPHIGDAAGPLCRIGRVPTPAETPSLQFDRVVGPLLPLLVNHSRAATPVCCAVAPHN
jgi:hypothetical protein